MRLFIKDKKELTKLGNNSKLNGKKVKEAGIIFCSNINIALV